MTSNNETSLSTPPPVAQVYNTSNDVVDAAIRRNNRWLVLASVALVATLAALIGFVGFALSSATFNVDSPKSKIAAAATSSAEVSSLSETSAFGSLSCVLSDSSTPLEFQWASISNDHAPSVRINLVGESSMAYTGFTFRLVDGSKLEFEISKANAEPVFVTLSESQAEAMGRPDRSALIELVSSEVGECLVHLSTLLGEQNIIAKETKSVSPIMQLSKVFYKISGDASEPASRNWDKQQVDALAARANNAISSLGSKSGKQFKKPEMNMLVSEEEQAKRRMLHERELQAGCPTSSLTQWYRLGDGKCDPEFNTAACNFDNFDCCSKKCKNYGSLWGGRTPADDDGNTHPVYDCAGSDSDAANCVPNCPVRQEFQSHLGDGYCDRDLNIAACGFDLGDCKEETCEDGEFRCGSGGFAAKSAASGLCQKNYCDNTDFGMCGSGDSCWTWLCGDCRCHYHCTRHDTACSCNGLLSWSCLNVFTISCDR